METSASSAGLSGEHSLILLDLMLPGMDGFAICRALREQIDVPILMVTARQEDIDKIRGLGLGADDYIEKPFSPSVLVARVKAHLARYRRLTGSERTSGEIQIGGIRLNEETHRVYVDGREVELTNKEYELLLFFMLNVDVVFSREQLYERIWGLGRHGRQRNSRCAYQSPAQKDRAGSSQSALHCLCLGRGVSV